MLCMDGDALYAEGYIHLLHLCALIAETIITLIVLHVNRYEREN